MPISKEHLFFITAALFFLSAPEAYAQSMPLDLSGSSGMQNDAGMYLPVAGGKFRKKILDYTRQADYAGEQHIISLDDRWLVFVLPLQKEPFILIDLERGGRKKIFYADSLSPLEPYDFDMYWESDFELIVIRKSPAAYYSLELKDPFPVVKELKNLESSYDRNFVREGVYFGFDNALDEGRLAEKIPEFKYKQGESLNIFYADQQIAVYEQKMGLWGIQRPVLKSLSVAPDHSRIFYAVAWTGSAWNNRPIQLYCLSVKDKTVTLIDDRFVPGLMVWTSDSNKFIYRWRDKYKGLELVEIEF